MRHITRWIAASVVLALLLGGGSVPHWTVVVSSLLAAGVLALGLSWSEAGWKQALVAVFIFEFLVGTVNMLDEAIFFHVLPPARFVTAFAGATLVSLLLAALLSLVPPLRGPSPRNRSFPRRLWVRVALLAFAYVLLYKAAGTLVWPYIKGFYQLRPLPGLGELVVVQIIRGVIFLAAAWPWLRILKVSRRRAVLFFGAAYSVLGGISPLLLPNPMMPANIRLAHGFEVGTSNFVFGALVGWALAAKRLEAKNAAPQMALP